MNPKSVQKLLESSPELKEFIAYLSEKAKEINTLAGLEDLGFEQRAHEVAVRVGVYARIKDILGPLLKENIQSDAPDPSEYVT